MNENSTRLLEEAESKLRYTHVLTKQLRQAEHDYKDAMNIFASSLASEYGFMVSDTIQDESEGYAPTQINHFEVYDMRGESSDPEKQWLVWAIGDDGARIPINGRYKINILARP